VPDIDDLAAWLRTTLDRVEQQARAAAHGGAWRYCDGNSVGAWTLYDEHWAIADLRTYRHDKYDYSSRMPAARHPGYVDADANGAHIAFWDPARVLRLVEATRRILDEHQPASVTYWPTMMCGICADPNADTVDDPLGSDGPWTPNADHPCPTLRLAAVWLDDQPGYRDEWRP
jgi:hypothetical protein